MKKQIAEDLISLLTPEERERIVRMCWEDRTAFESIEFQFGVGPNQVVKLMRAELSQSAFRLWRKRVFEKGRLKNAKTRGFTEGRFKCARQSIDGITKGFK